MPHLNTLHAAAGDIPPLPMRPVRRARRGAVLVVEDRYDVRQGMAQLLELHGFVVVDAGDGVQALAHLRTDPPGFALMLLDLIMPGPVSGVDLRAQQLADPALAAIPTIVVSATDAAAEVRDSLRPDGWVAKPFRFDDLLTLVKEYVVPEAGALITE